MLQRLQAEFAVKSYHVDVPEIVNHVRLLLRGRERERKGGGGGGGEGHRLDDFIKKL